jgi:cystathionine gamma-synthase
MQRFLRNVGDDVVLDAGGAVALSARNNRGLTGVGIDVHDFFAHGVFAVTFPAVLAPVAKKFWQHSGEIVSSRQAAAVLEVVERTCYENSNNSRSSSEALDVGSRGAGEENSWSPTYSEAGSANSEAGSVDNDGAGAGTATGSGESAASAAEESGNSRDASGQREEPAFMMEEPAYHVAAAQIDDPPHKALRKRISSIVMEDERNIFLYPTGMATIAAGIVYSVWHGYDRGRYSL